MDDINKVLHWRYDSSLYETVEALEVQLENVFLVFFWTIKSKICTEVPETTHSAGIVCETLKLRFYPYQPNIGVTLLVNGIQQINHQR